MHTVLQNVPMLHDVSIKNAYEIKTQTRKLNVIIYVFLFQTDIHSMSEKFQNKI